MKTDNVIIQKGIQIIILSFLVVFSSCGQTTQNQNIKTMKLNELTPQEEAVIVHKGTERPFTGKLLNNKQEGTYTCKRCDAPLYHSQSKFESNCGWPSFDDEIDGAVLRIPDADGRRTEIVCAKCGAHLGHVFLGEKFTPKNTRHCVNSISMKFVPADAATTTTEVAYFASGCFWGTEYHFMKTAGVRSTTVGYMGGDVENPTYKQVCTGKTGHVETTEVVFDTSQTSYENLIKLFFETHDFTQVDGQGPDIGTQYRSVIFYVNDEQKKVAQTYLQILSAKGYKVATQLLPAENSEFWEAEDYHQEYYDKKNGTPYCHIYRKIF